MINISDFISNFVTRRATSLFEADLEANRDTLFGEIQGKSVMVIGGAGSIGSSFIKALLKYEPARLFVADISENGLTELTRDLRSTYGLKVPDVYKTYPVNFADPVFERIYRNEGPFEIVANFAAHKHVRSEKDEYSITALLNNNVINAERLLDFINTYNGLQGDEAWLVPYESLTSSRPHVLTPTPPHVLTFSRPHVLTPTRPHDPHDPHVLTPSRPAHFFCVSTDKAANPVNIMGASKKIMEEVIMAYSGSFPVTTARFANVAFSGGSLPDGFINRIMKGQPLSAPSDVKRYFVSPEESGQICLLACILGKSGEIFFPKLAEGQMMTFGEIAKELLRYLGYEPVVCGTEEEAKRMTAAPPHPPTPSPAAAPHPREGGRPGVTSNQQPATSNQQPATSNQQPATSNQQPVTSNRSPYPLYLFTSDTSGEKPFEEFYTDGEEVDLTTYQSLGVIKNAPKKKMEEIREMIAALKEVTANPKATKEDIVAVLKGFLPNFEHVETGRNLDQRM
jgi:FlaA1/EpsC-like NDP-sugar epimerase